MLASGQNAARKAIKENIPGTAGFDPQKMSKLYEVGYRAALAGPVWHADPPGLQEQASPP